MVKLDRDIKTFWSKNLSILKFSPITNRGRFLGGTFLAFAPIYLQLNLYILVFLGCFLGKVGRLWISKYNKNDLKIFNPWPPSDIENMST